jgi:fructoselysine 6-kinase
MKVACFSAAALDFFPQQNAHFAGGNSLNQAVRFRQMGHASAFLGALGYDEPGERIAALLRREGVDVSHLRRLPGPTASNQIVNDAQGERYGVEGTWQGGVYDEYRLAEADWEFLQGFDVWATQANNPCYREALARKRAAQFLCVDFLHLRDYGLLRDSLGAVDIAYFGGTDDMAPELAAIARAAPAGSSLLVLTLGAGGSIAFHGEHAYPQPALSGGKIVDTTGCGDAFQAAFTASYHAARDIPAALRAGAALGAKAAAHYGGLPWE